MKIVKYIIKDNGIPILFCPKKVHSDIVNTGVSAGYAIIDYNVTSDEFIVKCFGGSDSLKVSIRHQDCRIIQNYLNDLLCEVKFVSIEDLLFD